MKKKIMGLFLVMIFLSGNVISLPEAKSATGTTGLTITSNSSIILSDPSADTMSGNVTRNVSFAITPDLGHTVQSGSTSFRIRANTPWKVSVTKTALSAGTTGVTDADIKLDVSTMAGTSGVATAGPLVIPFNAQTSLASITAIAADVISSGVKTSSARDASNTNNYFDLSTQYSLQPDFFYAPGTVTTTLSYNIVAP